MNNGAYMSRKEDWQQKLQENIEAFLEFVNSLKPQNVKGTYVKSVALCATMSPSVRVAA